MMHLSRGLGLAATLALVSALALTPHARAQSTSSTAQAAAYTYVQSLDRNSVTLYDTAGNGSLTNVGTYPYKVTSNLIGGNGSYLFAAGEDQLPQYSEETNIDSYPVESNGALGARTESIDTIDYAGGGAGCSGAGIISATLDHTGHYMFVRIINQNAPNGSPDCDQWQTYQIASNGLLTYLGREESPLIGELQTINSDNAFAYAGNPNAYPQGVGSFFGYSRSSDHVLSYDHNFTYNMPAGTPSWASTYWTSADPTNHLAALMGGDNTSSSSPVKIASYTINSSTGSISTSNTWSNMPTTQVDTDQPTNSLSPMFTSMSPSGQLLAVAGGGFQIFHFNGASPLTPYTGHELSGDDILQAAWDDGNHFYVLELGSPDQLHVYTVTPTSFSEAPGSPFSVNGGVMTVVSNAATSGGGACSAPSSDGVNVCSPAENATVTSPVQINAAATVSGGVYRFSLWNGGTKLLSEDNGIMDGSVSLAPGTYHLTFDARNSTGTHEYATRDITVSGGGACTAPLGNGINVCSPAENATVTSPVSISAAATISGGIYRFSLWNGDTKLLSEDNGTMNGSVSLAAGTYKLTFDARNSSGTHEYSTRNITVK